MAKAARQGQHLLFASGQGPGHLPAPPAQLGELRERHLFDPVHRHADLGGHQQVLPHAQVGEDAPSFGHRADPPAGPFVRRHACDDGTLEEHVATAGCQRAGADVEHRGLAAAVRAEQRHHRSRCHLQADPVHDLDRSVTGPHVASSRIVGSRGRRTARRRSRRTEIGAHHDRIVLDLIRGAAGDHLAVIEHVDVFAGAHHQADIVLDQADGEVVAPRPAGAAGARRPPSPARSARTPARRAAGPWVGS